VSAKTLVLFLGTAPYGFENSETVVRLADAALAKGHQVRIFASADAVYIAALHQHPAGLPDVFASFGDLIERGLEVELCGSCLQMRGLSRQPLMEGAKPSSLQGLFTSVAEADAFLSFGG
jgi:sulfur relay (sulfurtransferase) complex TusBCD TusD component (DsrE family)